MFAEGSKLEVLAYLRVPTDDQARSGYGLGAQRHAIEEAAERRRWQVAGWIEDAASGKTLQRPDIQQAITRLENGGPKVLVAAKLDRLSRSALDFLTVVKRATERGWDLVVLDPELDMTNPYGRFTATVMAAVAELEREMISARTKAALSRAKERGVRIGAGRPQVLPVAVVDRIARERASGATLTAIADALNRDEVATAHGGARWWPSTVRAVIAREEAA